MGTAKSVAFKDAKHFTWRITSPSIAQGKATTSIDPVNLTFPVRIYRPAALQVGGIVVVVARNTGEWNNSRVLFYNIKEQSWSLVHDDGPDKLGNTAYDGVVGLVDDRVFLLNYKAPHVACFDLALREWIPLEVQGENTPSSSFVRCFVESISSFIYWDRSKGPALSALDLVNLRWNEHTTKGEWPRDFGKYPVSCNHGSSVYVAWGDKTNRTALSILEHRHGVFYWSRPEVLGFRPASNFGLTMTFSAGRLFKIGGFESSVDDAVFIYRIESSEWHKVANDSISEYTMQGQITRTASHSAVALSNKIIILGGISVLFQSCRFLEA